MVPQFAAFKSPIKVEDKPAEEAEASPDFAPIVSKRLRCLMLFFSLSVIPPFLQDRGLRHCQHAAHTCTRPYGCSPCWGLGSLPQTARTRDRTRPNTSLLPQRLGASRILLSLLLGRLGRSWTSPNQHAGCYILQRSACWIHQRCWEHGHFTCTSRSLTFVHSACPAPYILRALRRSGDSGTRRCRDRRGGRGMRPRMPREDVLVGQGQRWDAVEGKGMSAAVPGERMFIQSL